MFKRKFQLTYSCLGKKNKKLFFTTLFLSLLSSLVDSLSITSIFPFLSLILDESLLATNKYYSYVFNLFEFDVKNFIVFSGITFLVLALLNVTLRFLSKVSIEYFSRHINYELSTNLYKFYLFQPYKFYLKNNKALLTQKSTQYVDSLIAGVLAPAIRIFYLLINISLLFFVFVFLNFKVTIFLTIFLILYYILFFKNITSKFKKAGREYEHFQAQSTKTMLDSFNIIKQLQTLFKQNFFIDIYSNLAKKYRNAYITQFLFGTLPLYVIEIVLFTFVVFISLYFYLYSSDYKTIIPLIVFFLLALRRIIPSAQEIYYDILQIKFHEKTSSKIFKDVKAMKYFQNFQKRNTKKINFKNEIEFRKVKFTYDKGKRNFNFNVKIKRGDFIGVAGKSGNGKSTFINILCGFLEPQKGQLKVDNQIINSSNLKSWREKLGYVPQEVSLVNDTIKRNITLEQTSDNKKNKFLKNLNKMLNINFSNSKKFENNLKEKIGHRGFNLSGGQQQRISIARSLSKNPEVIIFDEATSSLDFESEYKILSNIKKKFKNATFIVCTHRLQTLKKCDTILYFKNNTIKRNCNFNKMVEVERDFLNSLKSIKKDF